MGALRPRNEMSVCRCALLGQAIEGVRQLAYHLTSTQSGTGMNVWISGGVCDEVESKEAASAAARYG